MQTELKFIIKGDAGDLVRATGQAGDSLEAMGDKAEAAGKTASESFVSSLGRFGSMATAAGTALTAGLTLPIVGAGTAAIALAGKFEQTKIAFTTMLGSAEKAGAFLKELEAFAERTPFEFQDLTEAAKRMLALGFSAEQVIPTLTSIGNAVAGLGGGSELINRITLSLGQMQAKGKVSAEEMRELAMAGIPAWQLLADKIGVSVPEAMKMAEKGMITASEAIPALLEGMNQKSAGLMDKQSKTLLGQWSNLKDQIYSTMVKVGESLLPVATGIMDNFIKPTVSGLQGLAKGFSELPGPAQTAIIAVAGIAAVIGPLLGMLGLMASGISALIPLFGALGAAGITLTGTLALLGKGALAAGAFLVGWEIGKILNNFKAVQIAGDAVARAILAIPGIAPDVNGALGSLEVSTGKLADKLKIMGVDVTRMAGEGVEAWADRVNAAAAANQKFGFYADAAKVVLDDLKPTVAGLTEEQQRLLDSWNDSVAPLSKLSGEFLKLKSVGADANTFAKMHWQEILKAAEAQEGFGRKLSATDQQLLKAAQTFKDLEKEIAALERQVNLDRWTRTELEKMLNRLNEDAADTALTIQTQLGEKIADLGKMEVRDPLNEFLWTEPKLAALEASWEASNNILVGKTSEWTKRFKAMGQDFKDAIGSAFDSLTSNLAKDLIEWQKPFESFKSFLKGFATDALNIFLNAFLSPLKSAMTNIAGGLGNWIGGLFTGTSGGLSGLGKIFTGGGGGIAGLFGLGGTAAAGTAGAAAAGGGFVGPTLAMLGGGGGAAAAGAGAGGLTGALGLGGGAGIFGLGAATIPVIGGVVAGLAYGIPKLIGAIQGKNAYEAGSPEVLRDFDVQVSKSSVKSIFDALGLSESEAYPIRKDIFSSPQALLQIGQIAKQQGVYEQFLARLEKIETAWGTFNFREQFEKGMGTGVWSDLNKAYEAAFGQSQALLKAVPDISKLFLASTGEEGKTPESAKTKGETAAKPAEPQVIQNYTYNFQVYSKSEDLAATVRDQVIPIIKREMVGGNTGLREAVVTAYNRTRGAY